MIHTILLVQSTENELGRNKHNGFVTHKKQINLQFYTVRH